MLELKALLLTQGMHGMVSQTEGLAKALKLNFKHQKIKLKPFWNFIPPKITPISENLLTEKFVCDSRIVISCGRKSVIPSIALKKRLGNEIFNIHIQDPKVSFEHFDLIISPEHDNIKGENILSTRGSIHYLTKKEIVENSKYLQLDKGKKKLYLLSLEGQTNTTTIQMSKSIMCLTKSKPCSHLTNIKLLLYHHIEHQSMLLR